jgi:hypothetical protein
VLPFIIQASEQKYEGPNRNNLLGFFFRESIEAEHQKEG